MLVLILLVVAAIGKHSEAGGVLPQKTLSASPLSRQAGGPR
jgi:hypothetical protein